MELKPGDQAPAFSLPDEEGKPVSNKGLKGSRYVVYFYPKDDTPGCTTEACQFTDNFPQFEMLGVPVLGVSQDDAKATFAFMKDFGVTFPVLLEDPNRFLASNAYGLTNVPSVFWVGQDGEIEVSSVGWVKADFEEIGRKMAEAGKTAPAAVFKPSEDVRDFRPG